MIASAAYVGLAWHFWSTRWRRPAEAGGAARAACGLRAWERAAILAPLALHGWLLYEDIFAAGELRFGFAQALSVMMWLGVALYWIESLFYSLDGMEPLVLPLAAAAAPLPALFPGLAARAPARVWAGLRPGSRDGLPLLGPWPEPPLWVASGHYRNGILLTPVTADLAPDHPNWIAHCRWLLEQGCDGLAVHGTTSEANSFSVAERLAMLDALGFTPHPLRDGEQAPLHERERKTFLKRLAVAVSIVSPARGWLQQLFDQYSGQRRFPALRCCSSSRPSASNTNSENARCSLPSPSWQAALSSVPVATSSPSTRISDSSSEETIRSPSPITSAPRG